MSNDFVWYQNISIWSALAGWVIAQTLKMIREIVKFKRLDFGVLVSTGGMPSAHSAMVSALFTSVGIRAGFGSALFATTFAFACVVMFDAQSVRQAAGRQARLLNQIVQELFKEHHLSQQKLAELLGHTRLEVFSGLLTGILVAVLIHLI